MYVTFVSNGFMLISSKQDYFLKDLKIMNITSVFHNILLVNLKFINQHYIQFLHLRTY